jgi:hypothetical protein
MSGSRPGVFFTNIQHTVRTWAYKNHGLSTYKWVSIEKNRYQIIWCLFGSINAREIKSCRLVDKSSTKVLYVDFTSIVFRFSAKIKLDLVKTKDGPASDKKTLWARARTREKKYSDTGQGANQVRSGLGPESGHARSSLQAEHC